MAAISHVFGEDVEWLYELQTDMEPEDAYLWVHGVSEDSVPAYMESGIEYLKETRRLTAYQSER